MRLGRDAEAEAVIARGRGAVGDAPALLLLVARQEIRRGDTAAAETTLEPLTRDVEDRPRAAAAWAWLAIARLERGDSGGALAAASSALRLDPDDAVARYAIARLRPAPAK
jgi:hypothetical protein